MPTVPSLYTNPVSVEFGPHVEDNRVRVTTEFGGEKSVETVIIHAE